MFWYTQDKYWSVAHEQIGSFYLSVLMSFQESNLVLKMSLLLLIFFDEQLFSSVKTVYTGGERRKISLTVFLKTWVHW